jgi:subtilase family serine protease
VVVRESAVPALAPGAQRWVEIEAPGVLAGASRIRVRVDATGRLPEADETNNESVYMSKAR